MVKKWANELNESQLEAASTLNGPLLILAGAGSGKTKTMTHRMCHMIEEGINPKNILAITFTNKAAGEMKARMQKILGEGIPSPFISTFHAFGYRMLKTFGSALGYKSNINILDADDAKKEIKETLVEMYGKGADYKELVKYVMSVISGYKDRMLSVEDAKKISKDAVKTQYGTIFPCLVYQAYEKRLKKNNSVDFDDLIEKTVRLLRIEDIKEIANRRWKYICVDEYQDTSHAQFEMVEHLAGTNKNVCVVGDDYQSIYAFRGADIGNILSFSTTFKGCKTVILNENYRSTKHIVEGAAGVIALNKDQYRKALFSVRGNGDKIQVIPFETAENEAMVISREIGELVKKGESPDNIAILYRTNATSRIFEEALINENIPYKIYGGLSFYERKEIKDVIAYLKIIAGYDDINSLTRIINFPKRGIGKTTIGKLVHHLLSRGPEKSVFESLEEYASNDKKVKIFFDILKSIKDKKEELSLSDLIKEIFDRFGLLEEYLKCDAEQEETENTRYLNVMEFLSKACDFEKSHKEATPATDQVSVFLTSIALFSAEDADKNDKTPRVSLMTEHKAKGLEFKNVFVVAAEKSMFKALDKQKAQKDLEEERRVFYVAMTRAKDRLTISYALTRMHKGMYIDKEPIEFLEEIPETDKTVYDLI